MKYKTTKEIKVPKSIIDQIIGQDEAVNVIKKAAKQKRHVLLIGDPGTGKSMLGQAMAELLPKEKLQDIVSFHNLSDENYPLIRTFPKGEAKSLIEKAKIQSSGTFRHQNIFFFALVILSLIAPWWIRKDYGDIMAAASLIGSMIFLGAFVLFMNVSRRMKTSSKIPKLIVDNSDKGNAPFIDATGAHAGALLGDVLHDPFQSGGLGTPAYERVIGGMIHKADKGVLFLDEIGLLSPRTQQELLTAVQEKKYPITGQSERSAGAMVRTEPVPCDFVMVSAGNLETLKKMHPALRSRVRGYGYEVHMNNTMEDTELNRDKIVLFIAQEVIKDRKIPHFSKEAVDLIIEEAKRRAGRAGRLTLRLRELGGLVRAAGDLALDEKSKFVQPSHLIKAKILARTLEQQIVDKYIENKKLYEVIKTSGTMVGRVNGLAVMGTEDGHYSGLVLPIESEVVPGGKKQFIATGKLGEIAQEAVKNVSAIVLKNFGEDLKSKYDVFVQFLQTADSGVEGDSASIAVATAILSALKKIPIRQDTAMTGSLSVRGDVMAIGGVTQKIEAAIQAGIKRVIIPKANEKDVMLSKEHQQQVKVIPVTNIKEVLKEAMDSKLKDKFLKDIN
ncbi:MAG: ATP-dependent protease LonB [Candidatus Nanoarchaeia archaeon]|nr:ATP-dependent protease LonB [Candidatus Nanoarchaeia archaeon]